MKKKILIIDDEPFLLKTLRDRLIIEGFEVITASDGESGMALIRSEHPDCVILDVMLPDVSGHQLCRLIKTDLTITAKIIMVTSKIDPADREISQQVGADAFNIKTTDHQAIISRVKEILN